MPKRHAASILESIIVIAIIGIVLGFLLPAVQAARTKALETVCKNNLHQISLAVAQYRSEYHSFPDPGSNGLVGGWTIELLPFIDQTNLRNQVTVGIPISAAPGILLSQPRVYSCPIHSAIVGQTANVMDPSSYVMILSSQGRVFDAPLNVNIPWASGPELTSSEVTQQIGPHHQGFFYAHGGSVGFMLNRQDIR